MPDETEIPESVTITLRKPITLGEKV
ncbi:MAG: hypothetical protein JWO63_90, partial [Frankiales bacterium]|nr:hypothetical protein [Frankiales bacterium]